VKPLAAIVLASVASTAGAGVLQECGGNAVNPPGVLACLREARDAATDDMLEQFLGIEQAIAGLGDEASAARGALKRSQRAFELYVLEHCHGLQLVLAGEAASLACEVELLRQRAETLETLDFGGARI